MGVAEISKKEKELAVLVSVVPKDQPDFKTNEYIDELAFLASTLNIDASTRFIQKLERPDKRSYVGKGKLEEIKAYVEAEEINILIFDDDLSPSQLRNLENELKLNIYDRSLLILDIFLVRAQTAQAKTQVELARNQYLMPRLTRMWTHLERQRGGTGTRGGAGEKEIETDRRMIRNKITVLKKKLEKIDKQGEIRRKSRESVTRVALVGYTNAGKSTLMNLLSKSGVYAKDELFATVDSTVRKVVINDVPFLLSDTVGFIRKLPHNLIESFKSTLAEVREADILLHVVDASHPSAEDHISVVESTLKEIGASDKKTIIVLNKADNLGVELESFIPESSDKNQSIYISAITKYNVDKLKEMIFNEVLEKHLTIYPNYLRKDVY